MDISEKELIRGEMWVFLILEPARLLGACKLGLWARMDSRPRGRRKAFYEGSSKEEGGFWATRSTSMNWWK